MSAKLDVLLHQIRRLEAEMMGEARKQESAYCTAAHAGHGGGTMAKRGPGVRSGSVLRSRFFVVASSPVIWLCAVPIALADLVGSFYQAICFPIYGIPKVRRADYLAFDRHHLGYLNLAEKLSCEYCAYVNGILAYFTEIAARTEQYWCPIKHAGCVKCAHSRYKKFIEYGDAEKYRQKFETIRHAYGDLAGSNGAAQN